jgi:hypothetical protein
MVIHGSKYLDIKLLSGYHIVGINGTSPLLYPWVKEG